MWYTAHVIMYAKFDDGNQDHYFIWENIHLVKADTSAEAWSVSEKLGREAETDGTDGFKYDDRPARWVYAGTRKVIEVHGSDNDEPSHGAEVTYSELVVETAEQLADLVDGKSVQVTYDM